MMGSINAPLGKLAIRRSMCASSDFAVALSLFGMIDAEPERKEEAPREGRRACELLPPINDAIDSVNLAVNLAQIYAWTNEREIAINQIVTVERAPQTMSVTVGLSCIPISDSVRGDRRFEKIVASLTPK
jgi:hypothetical protein